MKIIERIKDAVEHTSDSWQQKLIKEYEHPDEPGTKARKIIADLVQPLDKPNQVIINDIVSLIYALASNPDPSIDLDQVVATAEMLIHELVEPIPNPDKRLMDELLQIVVYSAAHKHASMQQKEAPITPIQARPTPEIAKPTPVVQQTPISQPLKNTPAATVSAEPVTPPSSSKSPIDAPMIKLIMDEMKDVIKKSQLTEQRLGDVENRLSGRIANAYDDIQSLKDKMKVQEEQLAGINKNLDKFISLYEIVINQYNPFIEHVDEPPKKEVSSSQPPANPKNNNQTNQTIETAPASKAASVQVIDNVAIPQSNDIHVLIEELQSMKDSEFTSSKDKLSKWIISVLKDKDLADAYSKATNQQEALKVLLKKSLKN